MKLRDTIMLVALGIAVGALVPILFPFLLVFVWRYTTR